jgi:hypothetical protein
MTIHGKRDPFRMMRNARRYAWLLAVFLLLSQSFVLFDSAVETVQSPDACTLTNSALPSDPSDCALSVPETRNIAPFLVRYTTTSEHSHHSELIILFSSRMPNVPHCVSPGFQSSPCHLRV